MNEWFKQLNQREKIMVVVGGALLIIALGFQFIVEPLNKSVTNLKKQVRYQRDVLAFMQQAAKVYQNKPSVAPVSKEALMQTIAKKIRDSKVKDFAPELQQTANQLVRLNFKQVPYPYFIKLLIDLNQQYQITVNSLDMEAKKTPGLVSVTVVLQSSQ